MPLHFSRQQYQLICRGIILYVLFIHKTIFVSISHRNSLDSLVALGAVTLQEVMEIELLLSVLLVGLVDLVPSVLLFLGMSEMETTVTKFYEAPSKKGNCNKHNKCY